MNLLLWLYIVILKLLMMIYLESKINLFFIYFMVLMSFKKKKILLVFELYVELMVVCFW